jgi:protein-disulfide isomerase
MQMNWKQKALQQLGMRSARILAAALTISISVIWGATSAFAQAGAAAQPAAPAPQTPNLTPPAAPESFTPPDPFPKPNAKFFTTSSPSVDTVDSFLKSIWGYDTNRIWRVEAIQSTAAAGVSKVTVFVSDKSPNAKVQAMAFYVMPDGKHAIADMSTVIPFGAKPFAEAGAIVKARANGAARGPASKDLLLVEFADLQCPHCKEAQETMDQIVKDFPKARVVFQLFPLTEIHASAFKAAAYGVCVQKQSDAAFFKYARAVFDTQDALTPATDDTVLKAAVTAAGEDPAAIAACADTQATKDIVNGDIKLAEDIGVDQTPMLSVNGHLLPMSSIPYESLKQIIQYQAVSDGVDSGATPETLAPKPVQPQLQTLPK